MYIVVRKDVYFEIMKSIKNYSNLTKVLVVDKNGHSRFVWVKNKEIKKVKYLTGSKDLKTFNKKELIDFFINKIENENREESFEECRKIIDELQINEYKNIQQFLRLVKSSEFNDYLYTHKVFKKADLIDLRVNYVNEELNEINGKQRGNVKSFAEADKSNSNPDFSYFVGYNDNCATCVAVFEARLRGFDVKAKPRIKEKGNVVDFVAKNDVDIWKIKGKDKYPSFKKCNTENESLFTMFEDSIKKNERYELKYETDRRNINGVEYVNSHVLVIGKDNNNVMFIYDPQTAELQVDKDECNEYLNLYGCTEYMRIDNLDFNTDIINGVME